MKLTGLVTIGNSFVVDGLVHIGRPRSHLSQGPRWHVISPPLDTALALFGDDRRVSEGGCAHGRGAGPRRSPFPRTNLDGIDYTITLALPKAGCYQLRALTRDDVSGRMGSARQFLDATNWSKGNLVMSSIVLQGELRTARWHVELTEDPR